MKNYIHKTIKIGWFKFSIYILGSKFSIRFEIADGWEN